MAIQKVAMVTLPYSAKGKEESGKNPKNEHPPILKPAKNQEENASN